MTKKKEKAKVLYITKEALKRDPALQPGNRGARKLFVTELFKNEIEATRCVWEPPKSIPKDSEKCPVQLMPDTEIAVFTQMADQDRHSHKSGTEIYIVMEGEMVIEADGNNYKLKSGDMIVVTPGVPHEVKTNGTEFMCRVVTINCEGEKDKFMEL